MLASSIFVALLVAAGSVCVIGLCGAIAFATRRGRRALVPRATMGSRHWRETTWLYGFVAMAVAGAMALVWVARHDLAVVVVSDGPHGVTVDHYRATELGMPTVAQMSTNGAVINRSSHEVVLVQKMYMRNAPPYEMEHVRLAPGDAAYAYIDHVGPSDLPPYRVDDQPLEMRIWLTW